MLTLIAKLIKGLNDNSHPGEIAHAASCGLLLGLLPKDNLLWFIIFLLFLFLRINKGALFLIILLGSALALFLDPLLDSIGYAALTIEAIAPFMATFLNIPLMAYTKINNTIVFGSLMFSIIAYIPMYMLARLFVLTWRKHIAVKISENKFVKWFTRLPIVSKIYEAYSKLESLNG